jgi:DNA-binding response OmpR family regulator
MRVLVVEDDRDIAKAVRRALLSEGFAVELAHDGEDGLRKARDNSYDAIVLDILLPKRNGYAVCRELRVSEVWTPILMLTAKDGEYDQADALDLGADDYLTKPFSPRELVARVKAVLRRTERAAEPGDRVRAGDLTLDLPRMRAEIAGRPLELTASEFQLLATLAGQPGRIFTRSQLLDALHGVAFESYERAIDTHVKNLRRKLEPDPREPRYLLTVYGVGYRFADDRT